MKNLPFLMILFIHLIISIQNLTCGDEDIDHCLECGTGDRVNSCAKCEDNYRKRHSNPLESIFF